MAFFSKVRGVLQHKIMSHMGQEISASTHFLFQAIRCMSSKLFVGGLSYQIDEETLRQTFEKYGHVYKVRIILDSETGNSRGFGFITFESTESAYSAIMALDGQELQGRRIKVNHAHDRAQGFGGGDYQGGRGYGGGDYQGGRGYGGNYQGGGDYSGNYQRGAAYNDYVNNYQGGGKNYGNNSNGVGGYNTTGGGIYDANFTGSGGDYNSTGGSYPSSRGNLETGDEFPRGGNESHDQLLGVAFGSGAGCNNNNADGSDAGSNFTTSAYENASGLSYDGADSNVNGDMAYDNECNDYQDRKAS